MDETNQLCLSLKTFRNVLREQGKEKHDLADSLDEAIEKLNRKCEDCETHKTYCGTLEKMIDDLRALNLTLKGTEDSSLVKDLKLENQKLICVIKQLRDENAKLKKDLNDDTSQEASSSQIQKPLRKISLNIEENIGADNYKHLKNLLEIKGVFLTGSLLLQSYLGEKWDNVDIDIIACDKTEVIEYLIRNGYSVKLFEFAKYSKLSHVYRATGPEGYVPIDILVPFENITMRRETPDECYELARYVVSNFDFEFCKMLYDGQNIHIINRYAVDNKTHIGKPICHGNIHTSDKRILKYKNRGFSFPNIVSLRSNCHDKAYLDFHIYITSYAK